MKPNENNYCRNIISDADKAGNRHPGSTARPPYEEHLKPFSLEQFHADIKRALNDSKNDRMIKATDLKAKIAKWT